MGLESGFEKLFSARDFYGLLSQSLQSKQPISALPLFATFLSDLTANGNVANNVERVFEVCSTSIGL